MIPASLTSAMPGPAKSVRSFPGHDGDINDVAFNHDGSLLATTGSDGAARIWDVATGEELHTVLILADDEVGVWGPSFSPDGSLFAASWPADGVVKLVDLATGGIVRELRSVPWPNDTSFDPTGARLAICPSVPRRKGRGCLVGRRDVRPGGALATPIMDVAWSPDGESIATASHRRPSQHLRRRHGPAPLALGQGGRAFGPGLEPRLRPSRHRQRAMGRPASGW